MLYRKLSAPITCQIEITTACNNSCIHCYNHWRYCEDSFRNQHMNRDMLLKVVEEIRLNDIFQVTFTGGETMLRKAILFEGIDLLTRAGIECSVNTNLTVFTEEDGKCLYDLGIRGILTSFASQDEAVHNNIMQNKHAFYSTIRGVKNALKAGLKVGASMVITKLNNEHVIATALFLKEIGITEFYATKASPPLNAKDFGGYMISNEELLKVLDDLNVLRLEHGLTVRILECYPLCALPHPEKYPFVTSRRCSAGITTCTISAAGDMRTCSHSDELFGNVFNDGIRTSWDAMTRWRSGELLPNECTSCDKLSRCSGGCRVDAKYCNGRYDSLDPYARPENVSTLKDCDNSEIEIGDNSIMRVRDGLKIRLEKFGVLIAVPGMYGRPSLVTEETGNLLKTLSSTNFHSEDVARIAEIEERDAKIFCGLLIKDDLVVIIDR